MLSLACDVIFLSCIYGYIVVEVIKQTKKKH